MHKSEIIGRNLVEKNIFISDNEIFVSKSPYSAFSATEQDEWRYKGKKQLFNPELLLLKVQDKILKIHEDDSIDLDIILALKELEFATSRMIAIYLNLKGISIKQKNVQNRLRVLRSIKAVSTHEFVSMDTDGNEKKLNATIYSLDIGSSLIFTSQNIKDGFKKETAIKGKNSVKEILIRNQLILTYIYNIKNIEYTKNDPYYPLPGGEEFYPNLQIVFEYNNTKYHMMFEFIRSFKGWENKTLDRMNQYKKFLENFAPSKSIPNSPIVTLVTEDDTHAFKTLKLIINNNLEVPEFSYLFTTDTRMLTDDIKKSIFSFFIENEIAKVQVLDTELFIT